FSSRRRHTRSKRDWSSDVCSSDLKPAVQAWQMGRTLEATLSAAFGAPAAPPPCPAFSLAAAVVPRNPPPLAIETMQYADGLMLRSEERRVGKVCRSGGFDVA